MTVLRSFGALTDHLRRSVQKGTLSLLSVDVFDTLLLRRVHPEAVTAALCRECARLLLEAGCPPLADVRASLHQAYLEEAGKRAARGLDFDAPRPAVLAAWLRGATGDTLPARLVTSLGARLLRYELDVEASVIYPNELLYRPLTLARELRLRVVFTSDMYLPTASLQHLLDVNGFKGLFDAGYVSADRGALKRTGKLFAVLCRKERLEPAQILHVGDDPVADYDQPRAAGLAAATIQPQGLRARRSSQRYDLDRLGHDPSHAGFTVQTAASLGRRSLTAEEDFGFQYLGLPLTTFVHSVAERCRDLGVKRVYFLAREGFGLLRIYEQLAAATYRGAPPASASYLCVSRLTTYLASARALSFREVSLTVGNAPSISLEKLLAPFGIPRPVLQAVADQARTGDVTQPLPADFQHWPPFHRLMKSPGLQAAVREKHLAARAHLQRYLAGQGFFEPGPVAVVDIGWAGQIQDSLLEALSDRKDLPVMHGLYFGLRRSAHERATPRSTFEGLMVDEARPTWHGAASFEFVQLLEALTRAPHGTVIGYRARGQRVEPELRAESDQARAAEAADDELLALLQQGIFDFATVYGRLVPVLQLRASDSLGFASLLLDIVIRHPPLQAARWLSSLRNVSDLGLKDVYTLGRHPGRLTAGVRAWYREVTELTRTSLWRQGTVGQLGAVALTLYNARHTANAPPIQALAPRLGAPLGPGPGPARSRPGPGRRRRADPLYTQLVTRHAQLVSSARVARASQTRRTVPQLHLLNLLRSNSLYRWSLLVANLKKRSALPSGSVGLWPVLRRTAIAGTAWLGLRKGP